MTGVCLLQPIPTAVKTNAMVKNVAEREKPSRYSGRKTTLPHSILVLAA
jgi:hypothetical protein